MKVLNVQATVLLWWLGVCLALVGVELAYINGFLDYVFINDTTRLSFVIGGILIWQTICCGLEMRKVDHFYDSRSVAIERGWFFSDVVLSLGMVGTVIGFMMMLSGFSELDITSSESAQEMIAQLGMGMATALTTTLAGLVSSILIKLQFFTLERFVERETID